MNALNDNIEFLKLRLKSNPNSYLFARLADYLLTSGAVEEALEICEHGVKLHPYYVSGHFIMGKCYFKKRMFDQAEKEFKRVLFFDSKYLAAHKYYAEIMEHIGWENAIENSYRQILEIDPLDETINRKYQQLMRHKEYTTEPEKTDLAFEISENEAAPSVPPPERAAEEEPDEIFETFNDESIELSEEKDQGPMPPEAAEEKAGEHLFEAVIEEEPPSEEEEERFSFILDDIFREEAAVEENFEPTDEDEFGFFEKLDDEATDQAEMPPENIPAPPAEDLSEFLFEESATDTADEPEPETEPELPDLFEEEQPEELTEDFESESAPGFQKEMTPPQQPPVESEESLDLEELTRDIHATSPRARHSVPPEADESEMLPPDEEDDSTDLLTPTFESKRKKEKIVTPTLGEIYASQAQYAKAIGVFEILRKKDPTNPIYVEKIKYLKKKLEESNNS